MSASGDPAFHHVVRASALGPETLALYERVRAEDRASARHAVETWRLGLLRECEAKGSLSPMREALLTRANVHGVTEIVRDHLRRSHGWDAEEAEDVHVGVDDPFTTAFWDAVVVHGGRRLTEANLAAANEAIVLRAVEDLETDRNQRLRVDHYMRFGGSEAYAERGDVDEFRRRGDRVSAKRAFAFGHGVHHVNPVEVAFGGAIDDFDQVWGLVSGGGAALTAGTADYDVRVLDHATDARYGSHF